MNELGAEDVGDRVVNWEPPAMPEALSVPYCGTTATRTAGVVVIGPPAAL